MASKRLLQKLPVEAMWAATLVRGYTFVRIIDKNNERTRRRRGKSLTGTRNEIEFELISAGNRIKR